MSNRTLIIASGNSKENFAYFRACKGAEQRAWLVVLIKLILYSALIFSTARESSIASAACYYSWYVCCGRRCHFVWNIRSCCRSITKHNLTVNFHYGNNSTNYVLTHMHTVRIHTARNYALQFNQRSAGGLSALGARWMAIGFVAIVCPSRISFIRYNFSIPISGI